jgi:hypothetical protein
MMQKKKMLRTWDETYSLRDKWLFTMLLQSVCMQILARSTHATIPTIGVSVYCLSHTQAVSKP